MSTQSLLLPIIGEFAVEPEIWIQPTVQRATTTGNVGWRYRRRCTITNTGDEPIGFYPYAIDLGDTTPLTTTKALANGNDVRAVRNGQEVARRLTDWDSATHTGLVWIVIPYLGAGEALPWDIWYGNANAGSPPLLTLLDDLPAFDIASTGANRSDNAMWRYLTQRVAANAGLGGWPLSTGVAQPDVRFGVPGAWQHARTKQSDDDSWQEAYSTYVDTETYYQGRFEARRARPGALTVGRNNGVDGVVLRNPVGIESVHADIRWTNQAIGEDGSDPIGQVAILTRNRPDEEWTTLYSNAALQAAAATIVAATYTPPAPVKELAFAVWPFDGDNVDPAARPDRFINAAWDTVLNVAIDDSVITQSLAAEEEIYELATEIRAGGGGDATAVPPYKSISLGNAGEETGEGTRRFAVALNQQVRIVTERRTVEVWNSGLTAKVGDAPIPAIRAVDGVRDTDGETAEQVSSEWMPLLPVVNPLANPSAATDAAGWTRGNVSANLTASALARTTAQFDSTPASFTVTINPNTATDGEVEEIANEYLPVGMRQNVSVGIAIRTANTAIQPTPAIWFYDAAQSLISRHVQADWTIPAANTWYRRLFAAAAPSGAVYYRVGVVAKAKGSGPTGQLWFDTAEVNDTEIAVLDVSKGTLGVAVDWKNRHAFA